jgi:hypothetical protein
MKRNLKILSLYLLGTICLLGYVWMANSPKIYEFLEQTNGARVYFGTLAIIGLIELVLLTTGISIIAVTSFLLIRRARTERRSQR